MDTVIETLFEEWESIDSLIDEVDESSWTRPSILPGWTNFDVLAHIIATELFMEGDRPDAPPPTGDYPNEVARMNDQWLMTLRVLSTTELIQKFRDTTQRRRRSLTALTHTQLETIGWTPVGEAPLRRFLEIRVFDCYVHEHDLRLSFDMPGHDSGAAAEMSFDEIGRALGFIVGKQARFPAGSSVRIHIDGGVERIWNLIIGDRATLVEHLVQPSCELKLDSALLLELACGRTDPLKAADSVIIRGDTGLGQQLLTHLAFTI